MTTKTETDGLSVLLPAKASEPLAGPRPVPPKRRPDSRPQRLRCHAKSTTHGEQCKRWAIRGGTVCPSHGGGHRYAKAAAARRWAMSRAERTLADLGHEVPPMTDPWAALEELGGTAMALVDILRAEVSQLESIRYQSVAGLEQLRAEVGALLAAMQRAESVADHIIRADHRAQRVRIERETARRLLAAVEAVVSRLGVAAPPEEVRRLLGLELGVQRVVEVAPWPGPAHALPAPPVDLVGDPIEAAGGAPARGDGAAADLARVEAE
jgi:hypothetical protein